MDWKDDFKKKHGLNKAEEEKLAQEKMSQLKSELSRTFVAAAKELTEAQKLFGEARKSISLRTQGEEISLECGAHSVAIKKRSDDLGFEILEDGKIVDAVVVHFHAEMIVLESKKTEPVAIDKLMGSLLKRLDTRTS